MLLKYLYEPFKSLEVFTSVAF